MTSVAVSLPAAFAQTITHQADFSCYPATSCAATSVVTGDLIIAGGSENDSTTNIGMASSSCSASGSLTGYYDGTTVTGGNLFWCIANASTVTVAASSCPLDCGLTLMQFRSTTGFSSAGIAGGASAGSVSSSVLTFPSVTTTASVSVVAGYVGNEGTAEWSSYSPWTIGGFSNTHAHAGVWRVGLAAGTYSPQLGTTESNGATNCALTIVVSANAGGGPTAYTATMSETSSASDTVARKLAALRADLEINTATDSLVRHFVGLRADSETNTASDVLARQVGFARGEVELSFESDLTSRLRAITASITDSKSTSDALARQAAFARADTDTNVANDSGQHASQFGRVAGEVLTMSEFLAASKTSGGGTAWPAPMAEYLLFSDSIARQASFSRSDADSSAVSDLTGRHAAFSRAQPESHVASDLMARAAAFSRTDADTHIAADAAARQAAFARLDIDSHASADALARIAGFSRADADAHADADSLARLGVFGRVAAERNTVFDSASAGKNLSQFRRVIIWLSTKIQF